MQDKDFIRPRLYHQKGWIANKFQVKNTMNAAFRWKKRTATETSPHCNNAHASTEAEAHSSLERPQNTSELRRNKMEITQSLQKMGANQSKWDELCLMRESRYSNFRTTISNRNQLLYLKPYTRYQNNSLTIDQKKTQIYKEINNPGLSHLIETFSTKSKVIQYLTQYRQPFTSRANEKKCSKGGHRKNVNILKQKLKQMCEPSDYQSKITAIKSQ